MASGSIGTFGISLLLETSRFTRGLGKARNKFDRFTSRVGKKARRMARIMKTAALAGVTAFIGMAAGAAAVVAGIVKVTSTLDDMGKAAIRAGTDAETLQAYQIIGDRGGVAITAVNVGLQRLNRRVGDAVNGVKPMVEAFGRLNVQLIDSHGSIRPIRDILPDVAKGLAAIEDPSRRAAAAMKLFDTEGVGFGLALAQIGEDVRDNIDEFRRLGLILDNEVVAGAEAAKDKLALFGDVIKKNVLNIVGRFVPALGAIAGAFASTIGPKVRNFADDISVSEDALKEFVKTMGGFAAAVVTGFQRGINMTLKFVDVVLAGIDGVAKAIDGLPGVELDIVGMPEERLAKMGQRVLELDAMIAKVSDRRGGALRVLGAPEGFGDAALKQLKADRQRVEAEMHALRRSIDMGMASATTSTIEGLREQLRTMKMDTVATGGEIEDLFNEVANNIRIDSAGIADAMGGVAEDAASKILGGDTQAKVFMSSRIIAAKAGAAFIADFGKTIATGIELPGVEVKLHKLSDDWKRSLAEGGAAGIVAAVQQGAGSFKDMFKRLIVNAVGNMLQRELASAFSKALGLAGSVGGGGVFGAIKGLLGFDRGGSFTVGGRGGKDKNLVAFRATRDEKVHIEPKGGSDATGYGMGGGNVSVKVYNSFPDANIRAASQEELALVAAATERGTVKAIHKLRREGRF